MTTISLSTQEAIELANSLQRAVREATDHQTAQVSTLPLAKVSVTFIGEGLMIKVNPFQKSAMDKILDEIPV